MAGTKSQHLRDITERVRALFQLLRFVAEDLHRDLAISAAERAVLETLQRHGSITVPDLARQKRVSRQHIQVNVDELLNRGLVEIRANPAHRRSPLIALTRSGERTIAAVAAREDVLLERLATGLDAPALAAAADGLNRLERVLEKHAAKVGVGRE